MGGGGLTYDYGFRIYNPALGKFLSVDPLSPDYPWYTPYQFAGNKPVWKIDIDGLEELENCLASSRNDSSTRVYLRDDSSAHDEDLEDTDENSLVTLLDINDQSYGEDDKSIENREPNKQYAKKKFSFDNRDNDKNHDSSLNFTTIDPIKISKSSTTPKSRSKRIKPQLVMHKNRNQNERYRTNFKHQQNSKTVDRKMRNTFNGDKEISDKRSKI